MTVKHRPHANTHSTGLSVITEDAANAAHLSSAAEAQLRLASVRITSARVKVLSALLEARCAVSHQDMQDRFVEMDRVTLYRALDCLTDAGLAHKIAGDDRVFLYSAGAEFAGNIDNQPHAQHQHGHFKCTRCAKVFCLDGSSDAGFLGDILAPALLAENTNTNAATSAPSPDTLRHHLQEALQNSLGKGFEGHDIELTIKGWCADCTH